MRCELIVGWCACLIGLCARGGDLIHVADGFPNWTGVDAKNHIAGRVLRSDAELRQRVVVIVEFDAQDAENQLNATGDLAFCNGFAGATMTGAPVWETIELPRDVLVVFVAQNVKDVNQLKKTIWSSELGPCRLMNSKVPVYQGLSFAGAPNNDGKLPFVYVMGYEGGDPLLKEGFGKKTIVSVQNVIKQDRKRMEESGFLWRPFYGLVSKPKYFRGVGALIEKGKPIDGMEVLLLKSVMSKNAEEAKEAQLLYDGLVQTRCELMWYAQCLYGKAPHVAMFYLEEVLKFWPNEKKSIRVVLDKIKSNDRARPLIRAYPKLRRWMNPDFVCKNAAEAKKIVTELNKMKKTLVPLTVDAADVMVQNGAVYLVGMIDELIVTIPEKISPRRS